MVQKIHCTQVFVLTWDNAVHQGIHCWFTFLTHAIRVRIARVHLLMVILPWGSPVYLANPRLELWDEVNMRCCEGPIADAPETKMRVPPYLLHTASCVVLPCGANELRQDATGKGDLPLIAVAAVMQDPGPCQAPVDINTPRSKYLILEAVG